MSVQVTQPEISLREKLVENKQRYGIKGKQILEADTIDQVRSLIGSDRKNLVINGGFDIWQRGITQTANGYGSSDRWENGHGESTKTTTQEAFTIGQTEVSGNPTYFNRTVVNTTGNSAVNWVAQIVRIEDINTLSGNTYTITFWAKTDSNKKMAFEGILGYGIGGSPTLQGISPKLFNLTTSWKKFTHTFIVPNIDGLTIGANNYFQIGLWFDSGTNYVSRNGGMISQTGTFDIAQVQVELGEEVTEFEQRSIGTELKLCQRYYQKSYNIDDVPGTITSNGSTFEYNTRNAADINVGENFKTRMRAIPSITLYSTVTGTAGQITNSGNGDIPAVASAIGETGWNVTTTTGGVSSVGTTFHYTAVAEL